MSVKNGIASRVSFCMIPDTRSGSAWNMLEGKSPASMPMKPKSKPVAASPNATGIPVIKKKNKPANISGTKFWAMKAVISIRSCQLFLCFGCQFFGQQFFVGLHAVDAERL